MPHNHLLFLIIEKEPNRNVRLFGFNFVYLSIIIKNKGYERRKVIRVVCFVH